MRGLGWIVRENSLLKGLSDLGTGCPGTFHPRRASKKCVDVELSGVVEW